MKKIEIFLKNFILKIIIRFFKKSKTEFNPNKINRIIIIRQHDQLGDFLITTPTIRAIRKHFKNAFISVVVKEYTAEMIKNNPNVDEIIIYKEKLKNWNLSWLINFVKSLRKNGGFDLAIVLNTISRSVTSDIIALIANSKNILSSDKHKLIGFNNEPIYTLISKTDDTMKTEIKRNLDIVKNIGVKPNGLKYDLVLTNDEIEIAKKIMRGLNISKSKKIVTLHFGTLDISRRFPLDKLAKVVDELSKKYKVSVLSLIGKNELALRDEFIKMLKTKIYIVPLIPIRISAAIIKLSDLFICNDTGTLHIAASQKTPTVSFHSKNDPAIWKPPHKRHISVRAKDKLITSISHESVMLAIEKSFQKFAN